MILGKNFKFLVTLSVVKMDLVMMSGDVFGSYQLIKTLYRDVNFGGRHLGFFPKGLAYDFVPKF